jgi:serine protease SohB
MSLLAEYGLYLAKTITLVIAILALISGLLALVGKSKEKNKLVVKKLNEQFDSFADTINEVILSKASLKEKNKIQKKSKKQHKESKKIKKRLFVLNFYGDIKASSVDTLAEEITAILLTADPQDEVVLRLESPGGAVNGYGLAASQLQRIREAALKLTIAVDKVAASGGYLMACVADQIIAAPFSIIGSIGVIAQLPNFHRWLEKRSIDFEQFTSGEYKRTVSLFGENTKKGKEKLQTEIEDIHALFKEYIQDHRPQVDIAKVATGEYWFAARAIGLNLIDHIQTSDDYLLSRKEECDIYEIEYKTKQPLLKRLSTGVNNLLYHFNKTHY